MLPRNQRSKTGKCSFYKSGGGRRVLVPLTRSRLGNSQYLTPAVATTALLNMLWLVLHYSTLLSLSERLVDVSSLYMMTYSYATTDQQTQGTDMDKYIRVNN